MIHGTFPSDFLWGTATSAHQVEGNNINSDFWLMEHLPGTIFSEPSGDAIDHYHRYPEDIALLAELGFNSYRFSIEWARIEPEDGHFSQAAIEHYRRMLASCHARGLKTVVTMHHFTSPRWLITAGGWTNPATAVKFARYCGYVTHQLGELIDIVCTINEANIPFLVKIIQQTHQSPELAQTSKRFFKAASPSFGVTPEQFSPFLFSSSEQGRMVILDAHQQAVATIKRERPDLPVGITLSLQDYQAAAGGEATRDHFRHETQDVFLEAVKQDDFVGVQTYTRVRFGPDGPLSAEKEVELTQAGYEFWPDALEAALRHTRKVVDIPMYVTENGIGTADDTRRIEYCGRALKRVASCLKDGLDIRGYFVWSAFDNYEWMWGYRQTFGIIAVDRNTQNRVPKPSARWLGDIVRTNGSVFLQSS